MDESSIIAQWRDGSLSLDLAVAGDDATGRVTLDYRLHEAGVLVLEHRGWTPDQDSPADPEYEVATILYFLGSLPMGADPVIWESLPTAERVWLERNAARLRAAGEALSGEVVDATPDHRSLISEEEWEHLRAMVVDDGARRGLSLLASDADVQTGRIAEWLGETRLRNALLQGMAAGEVRFDASTAEVKFHLTREDASPQDLEDYLYDRTRRA